MRLQLFAKLAILVGLTFGFGIGLVIDARCGGHRVRLAGARGIRRAWTQGRATAQMERCRGRVRTRVRRLLAEPRYLGVRARRGAEQAASTADFGVRFIQPVDVYTQSERAVKYGLLFVILTFMVFLLFEALKGLAIHPMQYGLAGAAVALFFLLPVSLSEHLPFVVAYVVASAGCVGLLAYYASFVLHSIRRGAGFGLLLAALYGLLYVLLRAEDYALLLGSVLLLGSLAAIMILTRRLDWARVGMPAPPVP